MKELCVRKIKTNDADYPAKLLEIPRYPSELYVLGDLPDPQQKSVAIVGARKCSLYGREMALWYGKVLAQAGVQVISGMAGGIDSWAHKGALEGGGRTFAVLGSGVDVIYPPSNDKLYHEIRKQGGILSEYEPGTLARSYHFPVRNRIISGLADLVLVIEARKRSGSLITADYALEQGKSVFALPGRVGDSLSGGCNYLLSQGAGVALSPESILYELGLSPVQKASGEKEKLTEEEEALLCLFEGRELTLEQMERETGLSAGDLALPLMKLCFRGEISEVIPGHYQCHR